MADYSLDDYIQKKRVGVPKVDVAKGARSRVLNRLGALPPNFQLHNRPVPIGVVDARSKIVRTSTTPVVIVKPQLDARNLLSKKRMPNSLQDARAHLALKRTPFKPTPVLKSRSLMKIGVINDFVTPGISSFGTFEAPVRPNQCVRDVGGQLRKTFINPTNIPPLSMPMQRSYARPPPQHLQQPPPALMRPSLRTSSSQEMRSARQQPSKPQVLQDEPMEESVNEDLPPQTFTSPIQAFRVLVSNLGPNVTYEDVEELFGSCGSMRKVKMSKPGVAEVYYVNKESAYVAVDEYHKRELDDKPMCVKLSLLQMSTSEHHKPLRSKKQMASLKKVTDIDASVLTAALLRSSEHASSNVDFTVHL